MELIVAYALLFSDCDIDEADHLTMVRASLIANQVHLTNSNAFTMFQHNRVNWQQNLSDFIAEARDVRVLPHLYEFQRFNLKKAELDKLIEVNKSFYQYFSRLNDLVPRESNRDAMAETEYMGEILAKISHIKDAIEYGNYSSAREWLGEFRDMVGIAAFNNGFYPLAVPYWRLPRSQAR